MPLQNNRLSLPAIAERLRPFTSCLAHGSLDAAAATRSYRATSLSPKPPLPFPPPSLPPSVLERPSNDPTVTPFDWLPHPPTPIIQVLQCWPPPGAHCCVLSLAEKNQNANDSAQAWNRAASRLVGTCSTAHSFRRKCTDDKSVWVSSLLEGHNQTASSPQNNKKAADSRRQAPRRGRHHSR